MVICLERGADLHAAQLMSLPLTVSSFSEIQIVVNFLVPAHPGSPGQRARALACVCTVCAHSRLVSAECRRRRVASGVPTGDDDTTPTDDDDRLDRQTDRRPDIRPRPEYLPPPGWGYG